MNSILSKIIASIVGEKSDASASEFDALSMIDEELVLANSKLEQARERIAETQDKYDSVTGRIEKIEKQIVEHESYVSKALQLGDEPLARDVAKSISRMEADIVEARIEKRSLHTELATCKENLRETEITVNRLKHEASTIQVSGNVKKAQAVVASRENDHIETAVDAMNRLNKTKRDNKLVDLAKVEGKEEEIEQEGKKLEGSEKNLMEKLKNVGIAPEADEVDKILSRVIDKSKGDGIK